MKILILFCDMLRANRLKIVNKDIQNITAFDQWVKDFGGCTYVNCYTPAPDTPRSLACFYTGIYPKYNGCKLRIEWPKYYLHQECSTIFELLKKSNFDVYTNFTSHELNTGILPKNEFKNVINFNSFLEIIDNDLIMNKNKNACFFLTLNDYHHCVEDYSSLKRADKKGHKELINSFNIFFKKYDKDSFDYIFIFSDHGCLLSDDKINLKNKFNLLRDNRTKIFLHVRKKGEKTSYVDSSLRSIMDIYPTCNEILKNNTPKNINGISLFKEDAHKFLIIEDASNFKPYLGMYNDIWRYKTLDYSYYISISDGTKLEFENFNDSKQLNKKIDLKEVVDRIFTISCSYQEVKKRNDILTSYEAMNKAYNKMNFSSGRRRNYLFKIYFYKIIAKFSKIIKFIFNF